VQTEESSVLLDGRAEWLVEDLAESLAALFDSTLLRSVLVAEAVHRPPLFEEHLGAVGRLLADRHPKTPGRPVESSVGTAKISDQVLGGERGQVQ
jgi:hypothetical protein